MEFTNQALDLALKPSSGKIGFANGILMKQSYHRTRKSTAERMMTMQIRRLTVEDTAFAMGAAQVFKGRFPESDGMEEFLASSQNILLIAEEEGMPLGFLLAYRLTRWDQARPMMFVYEVEVLEAYQRQGIGRTLIGEIQRISRQAGCLKLFLITNASNEAAMALYTATGLRRSADDDVLLTYNLA